MCACVRVSVRGEDRRERKRVTALWLVGELGRGCRVVSEGCAGKCSWMVWSGVVNHATCSYYL